MGQGRSGYRVVRQMPTRWHDNDIYGHLNNTVHYQLFDTAVNGHLLDRGVLDPTKGDTVFWVVESGCRYLAPIAFPDAVTAGLRVAHLGASSVRYEIALYAGDGESPSAEGVFLHVCVSRTSRRAVPIPAAIRAVLEAMRT